ncbi:class I SAM-dependent methyltransferase [Cytophagales bacterium LB-30]|uniref:Class I SAM-dependent methyltransferase n=1 Tax=Shiella aurantiaca TaxID=3058365 RepID=A0ABT8F552_9BACT|nr:class I SAM-dependent methyltransferase [Shiella aurantiaca]MDN4165499.1 class I SAM-dependent methyltransferase [Shiella aurantiaca]
MTLEQLQGALAHTDVYLIDQILKGRFQPSMKLLDAGSGEGRNLHWFIKNGYTIYGIDRHSEALHYARLAAKSLNPTFQTDYFQEMGLEKILFPHQAFDAIICSAVLHFAESEAHFYTMWDELWRVLAPQGILFIRMASLTGMENEAKPLGDGRYALPDGSQRFLFRPDIREKLESHYAIEWLEPLKTVVVDAQRSMNVMVIRKAN